MTPGKQPIPAPDMQHSRCYRASRLPQRGLIWARYQCILAWNGRPVGKFWSNSRKADLLRHRIAICFFGITRSLRHTLLSIEANILQPARQLGEVKIYSHFFRQHLIDIAVSADYTEHGRVDPEEYKLLKSDWIVLEEPDSGAVQTRFEALKQYGDAWKSDFVLLRNLVHQQHSLQSVTNAALEDNPTLVVFCRPDLKYHDSLLPHLRRAMATRGDLVMLPYWQSWGGGLNDRFSLCRGKAAIASYGHRIEVAEDFCRDLGRPLHSEALLRFALERAEVPVRRIGARATRIRVDGRSFPEDFRHPFVRRIHRRWELLLGRRAE